MNTPLPNPVSANIAAMNAAASKAAKQANNDGQEFKQVLANQVKAKDANAKDSTQQSNAESNVKTREVLAREQAQHLQRRQLQIKANEQAQGQQPVEQTLPGQQALDPALQAGASQLSDQALPTEATEQLGLADSSVDEALAPLVAGEQLSKEAGLPIAQPVTPEVQSSQSPVAGAVRDALAGMKQPVDELGKQARDLNAKDVLAESGKLDKLSTAELEALLDKSAGAAVTAKSVSDSQATSLTGEQGSRFAETLAQQAALQQTSATGHTAQTTAAQALAVDPRSTQIAAPFGQNGWNQAIGQKVVWMAAGGEQSATLTLNPPDLGPLQVVIHVHNGQADTTFLSDQADVRRALEDGMANLRDMMSQSGMQLGQANVRSGQQEAQSQSSGARAQSGQDANNNEVNPVLAKAAKVMGMVDTYV